MKKSSWDEYSGIIYFIGIVGVILVVLFWSNITLLIAGRGWNSNVGTSCEDVTTYDYDWDNDMFCTREDGSTFYTDYEGARQAESQR